MDRRPSIPKAKHIARKKGSALVPQGEGKHRGPVKRDGLAIGLAGIAGGWAGSDQLADLLDKHDRRGSRFVTNLDS